MNKLAAIRIIYDDQSYSEEIPVTALAENIQWGESDTLIDILGSIDLTHKGNLQDQIDELNNKIKNIHGDVISVNGRTGAVILNAADIGAGTGNYNKPIGGIPKTDLASSVQTSLGKADTALQSYTEIDPTVPAWAKQPNKPTYTAQEVGALPIDAQITIEVDNTLSIQGAAADAKKVGNELTQIKQNLGNQQSRAETAQALKINKPIADPNGTNGQILQTDGQGGTVWVNKQTDEQIANAVTDWLDDRVTPGSSTIIVDDTLNIQGAAADAKKTGDEISSLKEDSNQHRKSIISINGDVALSGENKKVVDNSGNIVTSANFAVILNLPNYCLVTVDKTLELQNCYWKTDGTWIARGSLYTLNSGDSPKLIYNANAGITALNVRYPNASPAPDLDDFINSIHIKWIGGNDLDALFGKTAIEHTSIEWEYGAVTSAGVESPNEAIIRTNEITHVIEVTTPNDIEVRAVCKKTDGTYVASAYFSGVHKFDTAIYDSIRLNARYTNSRNIVSIKDIVEQITIDDCDVFMFRGRYADTGYSSLHDCYKTGYYGISVNDLPNMTDKPYDMNVGGTLFVYGRGFGNIVLRIIVTVNGDVYMAIGTKGFVLVNKSDADANNPINITWEKGAINQTTGADADSSARIRSNGKTPVGEGVKIKVPAEMEISVIAYNSNDERIETTGLQQSDFYHYPYPNESYFRVFGGYIDKRTTITTADGNKYGISYLPISADAPMWYTLGDSITQGYYSESWSGGIAGITPNNYPTYGAALMGWRLRNLGVGGSGYLKSSDSLSKPNAKGQVDQIDFANCDICTLAFGVNDWHYNQQIGTVQDSKTLGTTMASNMKYVIEKILTDNPLCRLNIMLPLNCATYGGDFDSDWGLGTSLPTSGTLQHVIDVIRGVAELYHLPIIDQSTTGIANRFNIKEALPDGIHPALATMKPYGERIVKQIV